MKQYFLLLVVITSPVLGSDGEPNVVKVVTLPVFEGDVTRQYRVVGEIRDNLRKPFAFMQDPTKEKIFAEIWERGRKMGADAVIHARFSETKRTLFDHGKTPITGTAIKYINSAERQELAD